MSEENNKMKLSEAAHRLFTLFTGNARSCGVFDPVTGKMHTVYEAPSEVRWVEHIRGTQGVGCVPILDDGDVLWGAIDIDNHGSEEDIPIAPLDQIVAENKLPLVLCRSKSGGVHAYAFFKAPTKATKAKSMLGGWAAQLGHAGAEIFPKQAKLVGKGFGNWINMPYFGGNGTVRYAFRGGKKLSLPEFIQEAERLRIDEAEINAQQVAEHREAPPCIQRMMREGVAAGQRNEAMYNLTIYLRKAFPGHTERMATEFNALIFDKALPKAELKRTIASASRPDYSYRCGEEPIRSLCDRDTCIKRQFGITPAEFDSLGALAELPEFSSLVKYVSEPTRWDVCMSGKRVSNISTTQLLEWRFMREMAAERLTMILPMIKPQEWERILQDLMRQVRIIEAPDDASVAGVIRARLREFAAKTDLVNRGEDPNDRKALLRGLPAVQVTEGERCVVFRAQDFINYLKRTKSEELKGVGLWFAVKDIGIRHIKMRVGKHNINVWAIPVTEVVHDDAEPVEFKSDL